MIDPGYFRNSKHDKRGHCFSCDKFDIVKPIPGLMIMDLHNQAHDPIVRNFCQECRNNAFFAMKEQHEIELVHNSIEVYDGETNKSAAAIDEQTRTILEINGEYGVIETGEIPPVIVEPISGEQV